MTEEKRLVVSNFRFVLIAVFFWGLSGALQSFGESSSDPLPGIQNVLPDSWTCSLADSSDSTKRPRGIVKPMFTVYFEDTVHFIRDCWNGSFRPNLALCFYAASLADTIEAIIYAQRFFSWCIPVKYLENNTYFIVTSPCYINNGYFTDEARKFMVPLETALHAYFNPTRIIAPKSGYTKSSTVITHEKTLVRFLANGRAVAVTGEKKESRASSALLDFQKRDIRLKK